MIQPKPIRIGCSTVVHLGYSIPASLTIRSDPMAHTLCGKDWSFAGTPKEVNKDPTCPGCLAALAQRKRMAA